MCLLKFLQFRWLQLCASCHAHIYIHAHFCKACAITAFPAAPRASLAICLAFIIVTFPRLLPRATHFTFLHTFALLLFLFCLLLTASFNISATCFVAMCETVKSCHIWRCITASVTATAAVVAFRYCFWHHLLLLWHILYNVFFLFCNFSCTLLPAIICSHMLSPNWHSIFHFAFPLSPLTAAFNIKFLFHSH